MLKKKLKFPSHKDYGEKDPVLLCPSKRVIGLHNQATGESSRRIGKSVRKWFVEEAKKRGWIDGGFIRTVETGHQAGCLLLNRRFVTVTVRKITINLPPQNQVGKP